MDDAALLGAHRVHLDDPVGAQRLLGGAGGAGGEDLAAALAVAGGVEQDPLALADPAEGGLVAEQLQRVDRLAAAADQEPVVVVAADDRFDRLVVLGDLDIALEVELVEDALDELAHPLRRLLRPLPLLTRVIHDCSPYPRYGRRRGDEPTLPRIRQKVDS